MGSVASAVRETAISGSIPVMVPRATDVRATSSRFGGLVP
jgi:hypothetical protein